MLKSLRFALPMLLLVGVMSTFAQEGPPPMPEIDGDIIVEGLNGPQALHVDSAGNLWITENGLGGDEEIEFFNVNTYEPEPGMIGNTSRVLRVSPDGEQTVVAELPSLAAGQDIIGAAGIAEIDGAAYIAFGAWGEFVGDEASNMMGSVLRIGEDGEVSMVASIWDYENANNPDETIRESHPYGIAAGSDGLLYVADAAANVLFSVDPMSGEVATVTAFEPGAGVFPNPVFGGELLAHAVPTEIVFDSMGTAYVSQLSGAPFVPGSAKIVTVSEEGEVSDFAMGLTMLTDLEYGPDGNLYATQFALFGQQGPEFNSGAVIRIMPDGTSEIVIAGLPNVTSIALDADGNGYVAINGANPPGLGVTGQVVYYEDLISREGMPMPEMAAPGA